MRVLAFLSDNFAPAYFTVQQPSKYLLQYGIYTDYACVLPSSESGPGTSFEALVSQINRYDLIAVQRVTQVGIMQLIRNVCDLLGKPLVLFVDDDYLHLEPHNPCFFSTSLHLPIMQQYRALQEAGKYDEANILRPQLDIERLRGQAELKKAWEMPDHVIVTTEELADVIRPYNKNISVFPNQMERVYWERDYALEEIDENGGLKIPTMAFGMGTVPAFFPTFNDKREYTGPQRLIRIGYSCTPTHKADYLTILDGLNRFAKKYGPQVRFVFIGEDPNPNSPDYRWFSRQIEAQDRIISMPPTEIAVYNMNLRNLDIGIAPLEPTIFNMSKSDLKAIEYSSWGCLPVVPKFTTYSRSFVDGKTALFYHDSDSLYKALEYAITHETDRRRIANAARKFVATDRLEEFHSERRAKLYDSIVKSAVGLKRIPVSV